jgi:hypothetical protein
MVLIIRSYRTILLEAHSPKTEAAREAIAPIIRKYEEAEVGSDRTPNPLIPYSTETQYTD